MSQAWIIVFCARKIFSVGISMPRSPREIMMASLFIQDLVKVLYSVLILHLTGNLDRSSLRTQHLQSRINSSKKRWLQDISERPRVLPNKSALPPTAG